ncbi:inositol-3-phosphate synthase [Streptomyces gamaensis]|uniref:Inositol-3-phosphate synthase n=1 Tax=Streptomyces gamaensis TaxID=1763542 RepID=A0ABW0Z428_9ACTN
MPATPPRTGVWLIGARGSVATTTVLGAAALRAGLAEPTGCVTEQHGFPQEHLPPLGSLVFGGHDITDTPLPKRAAELAASGVFPERFLAPLEDELATADREIQPGHQGATTAPQARTADALSADLTAFRDRHRLGRVVVVNVASTEPPALPRPEHHDLATLRRALRSRPDVLPPSSLYAYAALTAGCPYIDFTPSTGLRLPALDQLAGELRLPYAGSDAKTGETLLQSVLAPMFAMRALRVRAWSGTNLLGGGDGATLADPRAALSKTSSKRSGLGRMLGRPVEGEVHIDCVPSLGEWKTAWDHIAFEGFLGTRMSAQFTWQGCDSALAAPLVLDLVRLVAAAHAAGASGPLGALGFFFKDPVDCADHGLAAQYARLLRFAADPGAIS